MSMTFKQPRLNFQVPVEQHWVFARYSRLRCFAKVWPSVLFIFVDEKSVLLQRDKLSCLKPSPTKLSSRLKMPGCFRNSRIKPQISKSPTQNFARHSNSRLQRARSLG